MDPVDVYGSGQPMLDPYGNYHQQVYGHHQSQHQEPVYQTLTPISHQNHQSHPHHESTFKAYNYHQQQHHHLQEYLHHHHHHQQQLTETVGGTFGYSSFANLQQHQQQLQLQIPQTFPLPMPSSSVQSPQPSISKPTSNNSTTHSMNALNSTTSTSSSAANSQQSHCTLKWLEANFQFRSHVSISRSTIYELYQKFCAQNAFVAVCKATFGKIIRIKFPKVKSKRLGARGQSKYHYYNITFKDERKRCSMLLSGETTSERQASSSKLIPSKNPHHHLPMYRHENPVDAYNKNTSWNYHLEAQLTNDDNDDDHHHYQKQHLLQNQQQQKLQIELPAWQSSSSSAISRPLLPSTPPAYQHNTQHQSQLNHSQITTTTTTKLPTSSSSTRASFSNHHHHHHHRLTIFSNRHSALESYSHFNLNENDYHAIIQSMLSYMRLPREQESGAVPLSNDRFVFVNLYKIHCQCLLDSALAANLAQMRHYVMHFWQQLPRSVAVFSRSMAALDAHMYSLLEDIYAGSVEAPMEGLRRLNTVAHLLPVWLRRTFQVVVPKSNVAGGGNGENGWALQEVEDGGKQSDKGVSAVAKNVGELKVEEALRWSARIKFKVDFILSVKKLNFKQLPVVLRCLLTVFDSVYETDTSQFENIYLDSESFFRVPHYVHSTRPSGHLFHQTASLLWHALLREFRGMICRLLKIETVKTSSTSLESSVAEGPSLKNVNEGAVAVEEEKAKLSGQLLVDELDRLVLIIQEQMEALQTTSSGSAFGGLQTSSSSSWSTANHHRLYANLTLLFGRLVDDLLGWLAVEKTLQKVDETLVDEFVEEEDEDEIEKEIQEEDIEVEEEEAITSSAQLYLLLTSMQCYLVEVCQTVLRRCRFGHLEDATEESG